MITRVDLVSRDTVGAIMREIRARTAAPVATAAYLALGVVTVTLECSASNRGVELVQDDPRPEVFTASATVDLFRARSTP